MIRRQLLTLMALLMASTGTVWAASSHDCGSYVLRYRVVESHSLSPESANMLGVSGKPNVGVINIMLVRKSDHETLTGRVQVIIKRPSGLISPLKLRTIKGDENALFYAAEFDYAGGEKLNFELSVSALGEPPQGLSFSKTLP